MTIEERKQAAAIALDQAKSRVPIVIHVGTADAGVPWSWRSMRRRIRQMRWPSCRPTTTRTIRSTRVLRALQGGG